MKHNLTLQAKEYLDTLCVKISERCVGSAGNRAATDFYSKKMIEAGFSIEALDFNCLDWNDEGSSLKAGNDSFEVLTGPYTTGASVKGILCCISTVEELRSARADGKIILLSGDITREQLMPKNFTFYNPDEHKEIVRLLEESGCLAIITATSRNPELAGGLYPFPMIEDGDFSIPSIYMTDKEGEKLVLYDGQEVSLSIKSERIPQKGVNVSAFKGGGSGRKVVVCAHIDSKKGTPGAIDNATGVVVLLLLGELLKQYGGGLTIELTALNGEDYYSCPGQMVYLEKNKEKMDSILLAINLDGAGYYRDDTAFSTYNCPAWIKTIITDEFSKRQGIIEGPEWYQSDHSIFIQQGVSAVAITSNNFMEELSVNITHTPMDKPDIVDPVKLAECAVGLYSVLLKLEDGGGV